jgi:ABC-type uncharacterized transport system substrate-binding protein
MVRLKVDVIIVSTTPAAFAVKSPAANIPAVFPNVISPVESGLIAGLAHPGGNITGGAAQTAALSTKRLEILKEVVPGLSRGAVLWNGACRPPASDGSKCFLGAHLTKTSCNSAHGGTLASRRAFTYRS